jgi:archaellum component FlaC
MAIQYQDKTFSENMHFDKAMEKFMDEMDRFDNPARSFHVGTDEELNNLKAEKAIEERLNFLEEKVEEFETETKKTSSIFAPTKEQIDYVIATLRP